ncbi:hypothetical protein ACSBR1_034054 [Camellia fascicularis]
MASLRLHGGGGYESFSAAAVASSSDQRGCVGHQNRFFSNKNNIKKKNLLISKENQTPNHQHKKAQSHRCCSTSSVAANWPAGDKGRAMIPSCDHAYAADHWTEVISKFAANKRMVVDKEEKKEEDYSSQKLDRWMRDSVVEIVNNIGEAPFLVHIYSDDDDDDKSKKCSSSKKGMRLVKEKADADSWPTIKGRWDGGISPIPNGVILVEELKPKQVSDKLFDDDDDDDETKGIDNNNNSNSQLQYSTTKIWGVLIQAKGLNGTACYILKTCRVENFLGFCTHFCLLRVECFVDNAETQLKKLWLQR